MARARWKYLLVGCHVGNMEGYPCWHPIYPGLAIWAPNSAVMVGGAPKRCPDLHAGDFSAGILGSIGLARVAAVFLGEAGIEYAAEIHVAGAAAGADDDAFAGADIELGALGLHGDSDHAARVVVLPDNAGHPVVKKDLHARFPRGCLQRAHDADAPGSGFPDGGGSTVRRSESARIAKTAACMALGSRLARLGHAATVGYRFRPNQSMGHEKVVGENVVVGESANDVAVVEAVLGGAVGLHYGPVGEVLEDDIGRIHDSGRFLGRGAAA